MGIVYRKPQIYKERIPIDSNTIINWKMDESSLPFVNVGNGGSLNISNSYGTPSVNQNGLFNKCASFSSNVLTSGNTSINPNGTSATLSLWVYLNAYTTNGVFITKYYYNDAPYRSPYVSFSICLSNNKSWMPNFNVSATYHDVPGSLQIPLNTWTLLAITYDGTNLKTYKNGVLDATSNYPGTLDFGTNGA